MGGIFGIYMIGFFTKIGNAKNVWIGIAGTFLFSLWTVLASKNYLPDWLDVPFDLYYTGIIGHIAMFIIIYISAVFFNKKNKK
jgi:SSS family solute:Na+ symporter